MLRYFRIIIPIVISLLLVSSSCITIVVDDDTASNTGTTSYMGDSVSISHTRARYQQQLLGTSRPRSTNRLSRPQEMSKADQTQQRNTVNREQSGNPEPPAHQW